MGRSELDMKLTKDESLIKVWLVLSLLGTSLEPVLVKFFNFPISALSLVVLKCLFGALFMSPLYGRLKLLPRTQYRSVIHVSVLAIITNGLIFLSLQYIPVTIIITVITTTPLLVGFLNHLRGREQITSQFLLSFLAVFLGVALTINLLEKGVNNLSLIGIGIVVASVITSASYRIKMDTLTSGISPLTISASIFFVNGIISLTLLPFIDIPYRAIPLGAMLSLAAIMANIAFLYAIRSLGSTRVSILSVMQRPIAVILGAIMLEEVISSTQAMGMIMIFVGMFFAKNKRLQSA